MTTMTPTELLGERSRPLRVALVNVPFASVRRPSIALAQLRAAVNDTIPNEASASVHHLNHQFAAEIGTEFYETVSRDEHFLHLLGDWLFRRVAFPHLADNAEQYLNRCYPARTATSAAWKARVLEARDAIERVMESDALWEAFRENDVVGFSSNFCQTVPALAAARQLKQRFPYVVTMIGGANCEGEMGREIAKRFPTFDYVFSGPALITLPKVLANLARGTVDANHRIDGVFTSGNSAAAVSEQGIPLQRSRPVGDLGEELAIDVHVDLDYDDFFNSLSQLDDSRDGLDVAIPFETSRGCWWGERNHCTFCGLNGQTMAFREMPPPMAATHINDLIRRYGSRAKHFHAVDNIIPRSYLTDMLPSLNVPNDASLFYEVKANLTDDDVAALAAARVLSIQPGIEALDTRTLRLMDKGSNAFTNVALLLRCRKRGVTPFWNLLVGSPGETADVYERYERVLPSLFHLTPPDGLYPIGFHRFSPYHDSPEKFGLKLSPYDTYDMIYPRDVDLRSLAYYFADTNFAAEYILAWVEWLPKLRAIVGTWRQRWDSPNPPVLALDESGAVHDSRATTVDRITLTEDQLRLIRAMGRPKSASQLAAETDLDQPLVVTNLRDLDSHGFLFSESNKHMSLILEAHTNVERAEPKASARS